MSGGSRGPRSRSSRVLALVVALATAAGTLALVAVTGAPAQAATPFGTVENHGLSLQAPEAITTGPDGNLWFTNGGSIGRITPAGSITVFPIGDAGMTNDIAAGPDGNLWVTLYNAGQLARVTPAGVITEMQKIRGGPWGIGRGTGNDLWITVFDDSKVARYTVMP